MNHGTIIVSGALANKTGHGGEAWVRLNWVLGFRALGFRVLFLEQLPPGLAPQAVTYFRNIVNRFGLAATSALLSADGDTLCGLSLEKLHALAASADALINISGHLTYAPVFERVRLRVFVDIDPGFTQCWHALGNKGARLAGHDLYFTIGENIGSADCPIPTNGLHWHHTRPPVVLAHWPHVATDFDRFTTLASWRGPFGSVEYGGVSYGLKVHEFRKFINLPRLSSGPFELALNISPADSKDRTALQDNGWEIASPQVAAQPEDFQSYVQQAGAEFSVAQSIYVQTQSGWFSDRTAVFLASGKPALVQDTGFSRHLSAGAGLLAFHDLAGAAAGADAILSNYRRHCSAAREIAVTYFDSAMILSRMLNAIAI